MSFQPTNLAANEKARQQRIVEREKKIQQQAADTGYVFKKQEELSSSKSTATSTASEPRLSTAKSTAAVDAAKANAVAKETKETASNTNTTASTTTDAAKPQAFTDTNVFYVDTKVFLEGVQVPHSAAAVSYGVTSPPSATITLPAASFMRDLPETTKVHIIYKDLMPDSNGVYKWRLLFDGELSAISYSIDSSGAYLTIHAIHSSAYLTLMQIVNQAAAQYLYMKDYEMIGQTVFKTISGMNKVQISQVSKIIEGKEYKSMADLTYRILRQILEGYKDASAVSKWYWSKLGNDANGYKILNRIYGVSDTAKNAALLPADLEGQDYSANSSSNDPFYNIGGGAPATYYKNTDGVKWSSEGVQYKQFVVNGEVGTGGAGPRSYAIINAAKSQLGIPYQLGGDGISSTDCSMYTKKCWNAAGIEWDTSFVPSMVQEARQKNIWHDADGSYIPRAGDGIVVEDDLNHIVICDGNGGNYAASTGRGRVVHDPSTAGSFHHKITGYIAVNDLK